MNGALPYIKATDSNYITSIWQYLVTEVKPVYDANALAAGLNQGYSLNKQGTYTIDTLGLGILDSEIDRDEFYKRLPVIGYCFDDGAQPKGPQPTGIGDGINWEWRSVKLTCVPTVDVAVDGTINTSRMAKSLLKDAVWNVIGRSFIIPFVDTSQGLVSGLYPQIGYLEIQQPVAPKKAGFRDALIIDHRDFDITFVTRLAVFTMDGL